MPSSYTSNLRLTLPVTGELTGTWGDTVNVGITSLLDSSIAGAAAVTMTDADYTLTSVNGAADEARQMFLTVTGTLTAARNVICPTNSKLYFIKNSTTGGFAITLKTSAGTGISVPNGKVMALQVNGTNVVDAVTYFTALDVGSINTTTIDLTNLEVTNIKAKDGTASATIADSTGVMTITTLASTTGNITTVNATTVDATNVEVTNIKAKDGTTAITLADSTGVATIAAAPIVSTLTASQAVFSNGSKALVSNAITGTGNVVMSASPTLTGTVAGASLSLSSLTTGRVTYASTAGLLADSANLTFDGTFLTANSIKNTALTSGRVTFAGAAGLLSDSANLTWNGSTLAITGALTATADSVFSSTGALTISKGATGDRPTAVSGMLRFNTTTTEFEGYNGTTWASVGGAALINDTSTATNVYPLFAAATTGTASTLYTSNAKYLYKPSTGDLQASQVTASNGIFVNSQTVSVSYTIPTGSSAMSSGPITVASGQSVTVSSGSRWVVV